MGYIILHMIGRSLDQLSDRHRKCSDGLNCNTGSGHFNSLHNAQSHLQHLQILICCTLVRRRDCLLSEVIFSTCRSWYVASSCDVTTAHHRPRVDDKASLSKNGPTTQRSQLHHTHRPRCWGLADECCLNASPWWCDCPRRERVVV
jgi:hypothetical protein